MMQAIVVGFSIPIARHIAAKNDRVDSDDDVDL
jgi:hypothetical protein